jgi:hypothetical protein
LFSILVACRAQNQFELRHFNFGLSESIGTEKFVLLLLLGYALIARRTLIGRARRLPQKRANST